MSQRKKEGLTNSVSNQPIEVRYASDNRHSRKPRIPFINNRITIFLPCIGSRNRKQQRTQHTCADCVSDRHV
ncbi:hypothetical protein CCACVL1_05085 [Corchorus capsularis]|uniref:Uncharacterized protein n=1 Tax=Corchorus capsularis TaxID=210143 RepID=A0A1R3JMW6_COCAP|nr:hypothetical protein CCACVL1_05085 [Corchorus capsularis]